MNGAYGVCFEELGNKQDVGIMIDSMFVYTINGRVGINADFVSFLFVVFHEREKDSGPPYIAAELHRDLCHASESEGFLFWRRTSFCPCHLSLSSAS